MFNMNNLLFLVETKNADITVLDGIVLSIIFIVIVFLMLALLNIIVSIFKYFKKKPKEDLETSNSNESLVKTTTTKSHISLDEIKDDDMMAAVLVAMIDYHEETNNDVRVTSVKVLK